MRRNAIVRIVIYSIVIVALLAVLVTGLGIGAFVFQIDLGTDHYITGEGTAAADEVEKLQIDWAAGSIKIVTADTDIITFTEEGYADEGHRMAYSQSGSTLKISYSKPSIQIGIVSIPSKDLTVTVPKDWECKELELDGASLDVQIDGLTVKELDIDGAANTIGFTGAFTSLSCDGAECSVNAVCTDRPKEIDLDGAACSLTLTLPESCGFLVQMDGLSCDFNSDFDYTSGNDSYSYGDRYCKIDADGISCDIDIRKGE